MPVLGLFGRVVFSAIVGIALFGGGDAEAAERTRATLRAGAFCGSFSGPTCQPGLSCTNGRCTAPELASTGGPSGAGGRCGGSSGQFCDSGLFCIGSPGVEGVCRAPAQELQACGGGTHAPCASNLFCIGLPGVAGTCRAAAQEFQDCGGGTQPPCAAGLFCTGVLGSSGTCRRP